MAYYSFVIFLISFSFLLGQSLGCVGYPSIFFENFKDIDSKSTENTQQQILPRCGQNHAATSGNIFYKPFEQVLENERCIWIINTPGALGYSFNVQFLSTPTNLPESGYGLVFTGVKWNNMSELTMTNFLPQSIGTFGVSDSNIVIITFFSSELQDGNQNTGFVVDFEAAFEGDATVISSASKQYILESPTFYFKHPQTGSTYTAGELTTIVFPPNNHIKQCKSTAVHFLKHGMCGEDCHDSLSVYKFNATATEGNTFWESSGRICAEIPQATITHDDIILTIFQTDSLRWVDTGFSLSFVSC